MSCATNSLQTDSAALAWPRPGLLELSGDADGPARMAPLQLALAAEKALGELREIVGCGGRLPESGAALLGERARLLDLSRNGRASPTGHCRLLDCADGRVALNLAREEDWDLLPALVQQEASEWESLARACKSKSAEELAARGAEMGMAIARDEIAPMRSWLSHEKIGTKAKPQSRRPLVVDLSSLWAGPLAGSLLHGAGADVIKVESTHRPDGARKGNAEFFELLNAGKRSVAVDFRSDSGKRDLARLIDTADIVIEASRPRALRQLGVDAEKLVADRSGKVWLRILAHGNDENRIGFGDDIGVAAGLTTIMEISWGEPLMVGDAIADPLTGVHAALAAMRCWSEGGGALLTVSMRDVVRHAMGDLIAIDWPSRAREWQVEADLCMEPQYPIRKPASQAERLGHSTAEIMARLC